MKTTSNDKEILFFTIETNIKNVINKLEIVTSTNISNAEIQYIDEHGYDKTSKLLSVKTIENKLELLFESFYSNKFELAIFDSVADGEIESINIVSINQYDFYEDKDIDVRLDKSKMTSISLCGQHANNSPDLAIDGDVGTTFHSAGYGSYGDFVLQLGAEYLVGGLKFITRANNAGTGNGRIRAYDVMYKSNSNEEWKKVFNQPTEEAGENRVATFKPVLASEICIRVTNGKNKYVVINEIDVFKYNLIEEKISNLFTNNLENEIKDETTIEEIEALELELKTESYLNRITNAKKMYLKKLLRKNFEIELDGVRKFDKVYFSTEAVINTADIKYIDENGLEKVISAKISNFENEYTLDIERIYTSKATIVLYETNKIENITTNKYIPKDKMRASSNVSTYSTSYPSLMLDNDESTYFHSNQYNSSSNADVYISLDSPEIISKLEFKTDHPSGSNGEVREFKILYKESKEVPVWREIYSSERTTNPGWKIAEFEAVHAEEICIRIKESYGNWILINELDLCSNKSELEKDLSTVYADKSCTKVKENVKLKDIEKLIEIYPKSIVGVKAKMLWLMDNNLEISNFEVQEIDKNYKNFESVLRMEKCIDLISTSYKLSKKTDCVIESNRDIKLCIISDDAKNPVQNIIEIQAGINEIYSKNISGDIFLLRENTESTSLSFYNIKKSETHYKVGEYNIHELLKRKKTDDYITLEGKNFIIRGKSKWLLENLNDHELVNGIVNLDYVLDYLMLLIDKNEYYTTDYRVSNLKRIFWQNDSREVALKSTVYGSYIEFKDNFGFLLADKIEKFVKEEFAEIVTEQMISKEIYGPAICSFIKTILKKIMLLKSSDKVEIPTTPLEALATKLFLFSNNDRMITSIYKMLTKEELGQSNLLILSKICLAITKYLERDISSYFINIGIELDEEILNECKTYIEPTINIESITFENYKELVKEELEKFNQNYNNLLNGGVKNAK